jgi:RNA polymerase sigma factor (sigma-70 family)
MYESDRLAERFEEHRAHLRAVAYRMLGSLNEVDDAVQETWLRLSRSDASDIENLGGWLTKVLSRVCLDRLRARSSRRERQLDAHVPDPIVSREDGSDPEHEALLADLVGLALLVVLETLAPAERVAFVLHDMFDTPFEEIAHIVGRSPTATRKLASRARRRVRDAPVPDADLTSQREAVDAFLAAAREGNFHALLAALDPDVVIRVDTGVTRTRRVLGVMEPPAPSFKIRGARAVAKLNFARYREPSHPVLVNGAAGIVLSWQGRLISVVDFTVAHGKIVAIAVLDDRERLRRLNLTFSTNDN